MLHQYDIGRIKYAFECAEECNLSDKAKAEIAYCRRLISLAEEAELKRHAKAIANAIGSVAPVTVEGARRLIDDIQADANAHGNN